MRVVDMISVLLDRPESNYSAGNYRQKLKLKREDEVITKYLQQYPVGILRYTVVTKMCFCRPVTRDINELHWAYRSYANTCFRYIKITRLIMYQIRDGITSYLRISF